MTRHPRIAAKSRALLAALAMQSCAALAQEGLLQDGLLRTRDISLFGLLRLDMVPAHAVKTAPGQWSVDVSFNYQNTWSMSANVEDYIQHRGTRRRIRQNQADTIFSLPDGDKFLFDFEAGVVDLTVGRRFDAHWSARATFAAVGYTGGFMDGSIESFHRTVGFRDYVRPALERNAFTVLTGFRGEEFVQIGAPSGGLLDPEIGVRYETAQRYAPWNVVLEGAVKLPLGGERRFLSNGNADVGLQATLQGTYGKHAGHLGLAVVSTRDGGIIGDFGHGIVPTASFGYEYAFNGSTAVIVQGRASHNAIDTSQTDIRALTKTQIQASAGIRYRSGRSTYSFGFTENFGSFNGMPDFGLHLAWVYTP